jgi:predicted glutamine amidotransferase
MCRIFGFRSVLMSKVHSSLVSAENALMGQSRRHPDGWGLVYYISDSPHVVKSTNTAESDELFHHLSGVVTSQTVLAHIRKATHGKLSILNTHPFQYGKWTFAHNGNITELSQKKQKLLDKTSKEISPYCLGETDSELIFYFLLTYIQKGSNLHDSTPDLKVIMANLQAGLNDLAEIIGTLSIKDAGISSENYLTFVLTNGPIMLAFNGGLTLYYSTHKKLCPERLNCGSFTAACEKKSEQDEKVNHMIFSSEPLQGENIWYKVEAGQLMGVDHLMHLRSVQLTMPFVVSEQKEELPINYEI